MYNEKIMDHFMNPRNTGDIEDASGVGMVGSAMCGDVIRIYLNIDEKNMIQDAKFKTFGCSVTVATCSMATELIKGKTVQEALALTSQTIAEALDGLPADKIHCSRQAEEAIREALRDYAGKHHVVIAGLEKPVNDII